VLGRRQDAGRLVADMGKVTSKGKSLILFNCQKTKIGAWARAWSLVKAKTWAKVRMRSEARIWIETQSWFWILSRVRR
jgi:hypothetical protein